MGDGDTSPNITDNAGSATLVLTNMPGTNLVTDTRKQVFNPPVIPTALPSEQVAEPNLYESTHQEFH